MNDQIDAQGKAEDIATGPSSHVTRAGQEAPGQNFDPQIRTQYANEPKVVHAIRQTDKVNSTVGEKSARLHADSIQKFPHLNLSDGEFVVLDIKRHPIGLMLPLFATGLIMVAFIAVLILYPTDTSAMGGLALPDYGVVFLVLMILMALVGAGGSIAVWVYLQNQFYLTNESVIQEIQTSLFSRHEQTVSLGSIEDASFKQTGIMQSMLHYGTVRLSTEGEETTYRFTYVANPRNHIAILNNAVEAFKNGRAVDPTEN